MILKNKKALILSSLLTLLPIPVGLLLWNRFPEVVTTHWGIDGQPDGYGSMVFTVFGMPLLMLASQWLCVFVTTLDPGNKKQNRKPMNLVLWIIPFISNLMCAVIYSIALDAKLSVSGIMTAAMGVMFAAIGNYMPKVKMNYTLGIKVRWAYSSEENWNATHRLAGKVWFWGGISMIFSAFLPEMLSITVMMISIFLLVMIPVVYSWLFYRKQVKNGESLLPQPEIPVALKRFLTVFIVALLIFLAAVMFTGDIDYVFSEETFTVEASFYNDLTVRYERIDAIEYREGNVPGTRANGFGSMRLLLGFFENEEFGIHSRYTYYKPESCIVLTMGGKVLVLSDETAAETQVLYNTLLAKIN